MNPTAAEKQQILADIDAYVSAAADVSSRLAQRGQTVKSREDRGICDPDVAEQRLRAAAAAVAERFAAAARQTVVEVNTDLEREFDKIGLEAFADHDTLQRLRELFPSARKQQEIAQLLRDATSRTLRRRIHARIEGAEQQLGGISKTALTDPLATCVREFVSDLLHYSSVVIGQRGDFLRRRFNLRLKALVRAAHNGQLDSWTALSDADDEDEVTLYKRAAAAAAAAGGGGSGSGSSGGAAAGVGTPTSAVSSPAGLSTTAMPGGGSGLQSHGSGVFGSGLQHQPSQSGFSGGATATTAAAAAAVGKGRLPAGSASNQRVTAIEATSTAVLDELTQLRDRHDRMSQTRHAELTAVHERFQREIEALRAAAAEREHALRTEAANLRVKNADQERVLREVAKLVRRLDLQAQRYKREISLLIELSRGGEVKNTNIYALMARRLTQFEREDGTQRDADDELLQRISGAAAADADAGATAGGGGGSSSSGGAVALGAPCPSSAVLQKQHALLDATSHAWFSHQEVLAARKDIARLEHQNRALRLSIIHMKNEQRFQETALRNAAGEREVKLKQEVDGMRALVVRANVKLTEAQCHVIATTDELVADLVQQLDASQLRVRQLEAQLGIESALAQVVLNEQNELEQKAQAKQRSHSRSERDDEDEVKDADAGDDGDGEIDIDTLIQREKEKVASSSSSRPTSALATPVVINKAYLEPDVRMKIAARAASAVAASRRSYSAREARPPLQGAVLAVVQAREEERCRVPLEAPSKHSRASGVYWKPVSEVLAAAGAAATTAASDPPSRPSTASTARPDSAASAGAAQQHPVRIPLPPAPPPLHLEGGAKFKRDRERQQRAASTAVGRKIELEQKALTTGAVGSRNWNSR